MQKPVEVYRVCLSLGSFYPSEVNFHCLLPLKILVCFTKFPIYLWWPDLRQGPIFSGAYWKVFYVVFLVCITASLDLMSLHCSTEKEKIFLFFLRVPPLFREAYQLAVWILMIAACSLSPEVLSRKSWERGRESILTQNWAFEEKDLQNRVCFLFYSPR